jgi:hypothetical protein
VPLITASAVATTVIERIGLMGPIGPIGPMGRMKP